MPTPPPPEHTRWKPGQPGNPKGSSRKARITRQLKDYIREFGLGKDLAEVWIGAALGDDDLLKGRKPNEAFFKMLLDRIDGPITAKMDVTSGGAAVKPTIYLPDNGRDQAVEQRDQAPAGSGEVPLE